MRVAYDQALSAYRSESLRQAKELGHELFFYQDFQPEVFLKEAKWTTKGKIELDWYYAPDPDSLEFVFLPSFADVELSARILQEQQARQKEDTLESKQGRRARREADFSEMEMPDLTWPSRLRFQVAGEEDPLKAKIYFDDYAVDDLRLVVRNGRFSDTAELSLSHSVAASSDTAAFRVSARKTTLLHTDSLVLDFTLPMLESDLEKASLYQYCSDEEGRKDTLLIDAGNLRLQRVGPLRISLSYDWQAGCSYLLYLPSACFCDYFGRLIDTTRVRFSVPDLLSYGQVAVTLSGLDSNAVYVLQVLPAGGKAPLFEKVVEKEGMYEFPYVSPATVSLVLFEDRNRNGKWDGGHYPSGLQPERRWIFPKNLPVEADWRIEEKWELPPRQ